MSKGFKDYFGSVAAEYVDFRPTYPAALFDWLAGQCKHHGLAWDCGTGNGQAATALADYFQHVVATDASSAQIHHAKLYPGVEYRVAMENDSGLERQSVDLIVVAQALHWFDLGRFYAEARRVMKKDGLIAVWSYGPPIIEDSRINGVVQHYYHAVVGPYWPPERRHVETGYSKLPFPFSGFPAPELAMQANWTLSQLIGYCLSWSATARCVEDMGVNPVRELETHLRESWDGQVPRCWIKWPLSIRVGCVTA